MNMLPIPSIGIDYKRNDPFKFVERRATISDCGRYRYTLLRRWDERPLVMWVMLNPSTADAEVDDPTIRRCMRYAQDWGYGGMLVGNLFAYRATNPKWLWRVRENLELIGPENERHLQAMDAQCEAVVCAWGNGTLLNRLRDQTLWLYQYQPLKMLRKPLHYLELAKDGTPKHPLYLKADLRPQPYTL